MFKRGGLVRWLVSLSHLQLSLQGDDAPLVGFGHTHQAVRSIRMYLAQARRPPLRKHTRPRGMSETSPALEGACACTFASSNAFRFCDRANGGFAAVLHRGLYNWDPRPSLARGRACCLALASPTDLAAPGRMVNALPAPTSAGVQHHPLTSSGGW